jgi:hypothetical protein
MSLNIYRDEESIKNNQEDIAKERCNKESTQVAVQRKQRLRILYLVKCHEQGRWIKRLTIGLDRWFSAKGNFTLQGTFDNV